MKKILILTIFFTCAFAANSQAQIVTSTTLNVERAAVVKKEKINKPVNAYDQITFNLGVINYTVDWYDFDTPLTYEVKYSHIYIRPANKSNKNHIYGYSAGAFFADKSTATAYHYHTNGKYERSVQVSSINLLKVACFCGWRTNYQNGHSFDFIIGIQGGIDPDGAEEKETIDFVYTDTSDCDYYNDISRLGHFGPNIQINYNTKKCVFGLTYDFDLSEYSIGGNGLRLLVGYKF